MKLVPNPVLKIPELSFLALATAVNGAVSESWGLPVQGGTNVSYFRFKVKIFYFGQSKILSYDITFLSYLLT